MTSVVTAALSVRGLRKYLLARWKPALLPLLVLVLLRLLRRWRRALPPQASSWDIIRSYNARRLVHFHHSWGLKMGMKCWTIKLPHDPRVFATVNPEVVEHILVSSFTKYDKGAQWRTAFDDLLGEGIFNVDGSMWKMQRKVASHEFSIRSLRDFMFQVFKEHTAKMVAMVGRIAEQGAPTNAQDLFARYTLDSIGQIGFGVEIGCLEDNEVAHARAEEFSQAFDTATRLSGMRFIDVLWKLKRMLNVGSERELKAALAKVCAFSDGVIRQRRATSAEELTSRHDLLSRYMRYTGKGRAKDANAEFSFTDENLRDIVINFLLAGRDTTANLLTWSVFQLAQHPHVVESLRMEAEQVLAARREKQGSDSCDGFTYEDIAHMPYLQATLTEVLRLHPSVPIDVKMVNEDDVLPGGTKVYKGERVMYITWSMGRHPELWPEPERFDPMRFLHDCSATTPGSADASTAASDNEDSDSGASPAAPAGEKGAAAGLRFRFPSPARFPVFHAGPRTCLGKDAAYLGSGLALIELVRRFDVELCTRPEDVELDNGLTLWVHGGLPVRFSPAKAAGAPTP